MKDGVSVKEDSRINSLWKHLMHEEPGSGAHPEHADHVLQPQGVPDLNNGHISPEYRFILCKSE